MKSRTYLSNVHRLMRRLGTSTLMTAALSNKHGQLSYPSRRVSSFEAPPPAPPMAPPPPAPSAASHSSTTAPAKEEEEEERQQRKSCRDRFAFSFQQALYDVSDTLKIDDLRAQLTQTTQSPSSTPASPLSPWLHYLVGLRDTAPRTRRDDVLPSSPVTTTTATATTANADTIFVNHVFDNATDAALYVSVRTPKEFLPPTYNNSSSSSSSSGDGAALPTDLSPRRSPVEAATSSEWAVVSVSNAFPLMESALREMTQLELRKEKARSKGTGDFARLESFLLPFWRCMLEQAFLEQFCEASALTLTTPSSSGSGAELIDLFPYTYSEQPVALRRRLEQGIRALLCASAFTIHAQWEQHVSRHGLSNVLAQVRGLEFILLWWYANPDQLPIELASAATRFPLPTRRLQQYRATAGTEAVFTRDSTLQEVVTVEQHLRQYVHNMPSAVEETAGTEKFKKVKVFADGGVLCPAAMFSETFKEALRHRLCHVRHRKNVITSPLFARVLEVAVMLGSPPAPLEDEEGWESDEATNVLCHRVQAGKLSDVVSSAAEMPRQTAARRARQMAKYLVVDWLWPVVCGHPSFPSLSSTSSYTPPPVHELLHPVAAAAAPPPARAMDAFPEKVEDWAVLVTAIVAVAQLRSNLAALRRPSAAMRARELAAKHRASKTGTVSEGSHDDEQRGGRGKRAQLTYVRDQLFTSAVRVLLSPYSDALQQRDASTSSAAAAAPPPPPPSWTRLVFAQVAFCFEDCGWLRSNAARQPATPARLWHQLFVSLNTAFPNVFHAGNSVTVLWALTAMEGAAALPTMHGRNVQLLNKGQLESLQAWTKLLTVPQVANSSAKRADDIDGILPSSHGSTVVDEACALEDWRAAGGAPLCPQTERKERAAYIASASAGASQASPETVAAAAEGLRETSPSATGAEDEVEVAANFNTPRSYLSHHHRSGRRRSTPATPSFASFPPSPTAVQMPFPDEAAPTASIEAYLSCMEELNEEVVSVLVQIFRHYAALPMLRPTPSIGGTATSALHISHDGDVLSPSETVSAELTQLRRAGQPSFFVLLKLLYSVSAFGDAFAVPAALPSREGSTAAYGGGGSGGVVPSVLRDILPVCHPVVGAYLGRMQVYCATLSGRDGALALLHDATLQDHLNRLPTQLGQRRLVTALLWSGLSADALSGAADERREASASARDGPAEEEIAFPKENAAAVNEGAVFGSGSLAWHVMGSNQQPFFQTSASTCHTSKTSDGSRDAEEISDVEEGKDDDVDKDAPAFAPKSPAEVCGLVTEVVRHLRQLSTVAPGNTVRTVLDVQAPLSAYTTTATTAAVDAVTSALKTEERDCGEVQEDDESVFGEVLRSEDVEGDRTDVDHDSHLYSTVRDNTAVGDFDGQPAWSREAADELGADDEEEDAEYNADEDQGEREKSSGFHQPFTDDEETPFDQVTLSEENEGIAAPQWSSDTTLRRSTASSGSSRRHDDLCEGGSATSNSLEEDDEQMKSEAAVAAELAGAAKGSAVVAAFRAASPGDLHLFYSLLELLAWVANAHDSGTPLPTEFNAEATAPVHFAQRVGTAAWCARFATYYKLCATVWATRAGISQSASLAELTAGSKLPSKPSLKSAVLCNSRVVEETLLTVLQTCPDVCLVSLLLVIYAMGDSDDGTLLTRAVQTSLLQRAQSGVSLFSWAVECAVAQMLYHAGVTAATVQRWRDSQQQQQQWRAQFSSTSPASSLSKIDVDSPLSQLLTLQAMLTSRFAPSVSSAEPKGAAMEDTKDQHAADHEASASCSARRSEEPLCASAASTQDFLLCLGSLLLSSLQLRATRHTRDRRFFYRYNFYVNEFLLNSSASLVGADSTLMTELRVVLPSLQVRSSLPFRVPPQNMVSVQQAWRDDLSALQQTAVRRSFRDSAPAPRQAETASDATPVLRDNVRSARRTSVVADDYIKAFL